jgi:WD40 repeat protein
MALLDTAHLLSAEGHGNKKTIKIWDIATGTCVKTLSFYGYTYGFTTTNPQQFVSIDLYSMMDSSSANLWTFSSSPQHNLAVPQQAPPTMKR